MATSALRADEGTGWQARIEAATRAAEAADAQAWRQRDARALEAAASAEASPRNWQALPTPTTPPQDILPMVERFQGFLADQQVGGTPASGGLSVFVSLGMPEGSLAHLVDEAARTGATLVLRGMVEQSLTKTLLAVRRLTGDRPVAWTIDPEAFARFQVETVPVFVLTRAGARPAGCGEEVGFGQDDTLRLAGDVSIAYALDTMERLAPGFEDEIRRARGRP
jgi:conjugal transfer pilus assembly protein TrbC